MVIKGCKTNSLFKIVRPSVQKSFLFSMTAFEFLRLDLTCPSNPGINLLSDRVTKAGMV